MEKTNTAHTPHDAAYKQLFIPLIDAAPKKPRRSAAGRKPYEALSNLSDDHAEDIVDAPNTCRRFVGLQHARKSPDATTIWRFRETLVKAGGIGELFETFDRYLDARWTKKNGWACSGEGEDRAEELGLHHGQIRFSDGGLGVKCG